MKNSGNKRMIKRKEREVENTINAEKLGTLEKKDEQMRSRILMNLRNKKLDSLDETRIRITLFLSFTN